jgi:hypothetical protein
MRGSQGQSNQIKPNQTCQKRRWAGSAAAKMRIKRTSRITYALGAAFGGYSFGFEGIKADQTESNLLLGGTGDEERIRIGIRKERR